MFVILSLFSTNHLFDTQYPISFLCWGVVKHSFIYVHPVFYLRSPRFLFTFSPFQTSRVRSTRANPSSRPWPPCLPPPPPGRSWCEPNAGWPRWPSGRRTAGSGGGRRRATRPTSTHCAARSVPTSADYGSSRCTSDSTTGSGSNTQTRKRRMVGLISMTVSCV